MATKKRMSLEDRRKRWENEARAASWWHVFEKQLGRGATLEDAAKFADLALKEYAKRFPDTAMPECWR